MIIDPIQRLAVDLDFVQRLGLHLKNFTQTGDRHFIFSHSCETDHGVKTKKRANFFQREQSIIFHCYHCGQSMLFGKFIKNENGGIYREYLRELYSNKKKPDNIGSKLKETVLPIRNDRTKAKSNFLSGVTQVSKLPEDSPIREYLRNRKIPDSMYNRIGVVQDFSSYYNSLNNSNTKNSTKPRPRIVFPYFDENNKPFMAACRTLPGDSSTKYMYVFPDKSSIPEHRVYGLWKLNTKHPILVTEGQIDSLFLENGISIGGTNYSKSQFLLNHKDKVIIVPDNDWINNSEVRKSLISAIQVGFSVSFLPKSDRFKDVNDYIIGGTDSKYLENYLLSNPMSGTKALAFIKMTPKLL